MNEKVEIHADFTPEDYANALIAIQQRPNTARIIGIVILFILLSFLGFLYWLTGPEFLTLVFNNPAPLFAIALGPGWLIVFKGRSPKLFVIWSVKRQFKNSPALREAKNIVIDEEGLSGDSALSSGAVKWEAFIDAAETKHSFLFFTSKKFAQFIPKRFLNQEQETVIRSLAKRKMGLKARSLL